MLKRRSVRWFLIAGSVGLGLAIVLSVLSSFLSISSTILILLWPPSIVGLADPTRIVDQILMGTVEFGGNFVLYGAFGGIAGLAVDHLHR
jgi:hypothetical protein